ncbi:MAG: hypothetical protein JW723_14785 [Bacteroidales bacterium]|nr:hypothetical protein [Bacteroidales bacterium]
MTWKIRNIVVILFLLWRFDGFGQDITIDTAETKGEYIFFIFNSDAVDNTGEQSSPVPGDYYRFQYGNNYAAATDTDSRFDEGDNIVSISKDSILKNSVTSTADISVMFLKQIRGCWIRVTEIESVQRGDTLYINRMLISPQRVTYERKNACENDPVPISPTITENLQDVEFSSPDGLNIDRYSGIILASRQAAGKYSVSYHSTYCLENNSDTITIHPKPVFSVERERRICEGTTIDLSPTAASDNNVYAWSDGTTDENISVSAPGTYTVTAVNEFGCKSSDTVVVGLKTIEIEKFDFDPVEAGCYEEGNIIIRQLEIRDGAMPYTYLYKNLVSKQVLQNPESLREGDYMLTIMDADGCKVSEPGIISIRKDCLSDFPVFTPNTDGRDDDYYIPYEGEAVVYDRNGTLRHRFMTPAYWDGKDGDGNPLPMGTYLIVVDKKEMINITIIK